MNWELFWCAFAGVVCGFVVGHYLGLQEGINEMRRTVTEYLLDMDRISGGKFSELFKQLDKRARRNLLARK